MKKKYFLIAPMMLLALGAAHNITHYISSNEQKDNVIYDDPLTVDFNKPNIRYESPHRAASTTVNKVIIHYHNDDGDNANRTFWVWCVGVDGAKYDPIVSADGKDMTLTLDFEGAEAILKNNLSISFIVKKKDTWTGKSIDVKLSFKEHTPKNGIVEVWCIPGEGDDIEVYETQEETKAARAVYSSFTNWKQIKVYATETPSSYKLYAFTSNYFKLNSMMKKEYREKYLIKTGTPESVSDVEYNSVICKQFKINLNYEIKPNVQYVVDTTYTSNPGVWKSKLTAFDMLYNTPRFNDFYTYSGNDLGVTYGKNATTFKVWAPTASIVRLMLYKSGIPEEYTDESIGRIGDDSWGGYDMVYQPGGIWQVTIENRDLHGTYYNYSVTNSLGGNEVVDPYATACSINGDRGLVLDFSRTNPNGWDNVPGKWDGVSGYDIKTPNELSVYEVHIRDLTMDETWKSNHEIKRGTYKAFAESGTTYTANSTTVKTGFDHIEELGVNAIQILPFFDHDDTEDDKYMAFNWGYNPKNYNCLEGGYSSNPFNGETRVTEFKELVQAYAKNANHTRVIMDVVYNHVSSVPNSPFHKLMPKYFFRYTENGNLYEGSGCGNEFKTESVMGSKYIVDSLVWWAKEYKIKGFRFDLMGLIDVDTMAAAKKALYKVDPDIVMYGEGWTGDGSGYSYEEDKIYPVHGGNANNLGTVTKAVYSLEKLWTTDKAIWLGAFNDKGRNEIRGGNDIDGYHGNHYPNYGFISQGSDSVGSKNKDVYEMLRGNNNNSNGGGNPNQVVNYASCHDNWTLFDQLNYCLSPDGGVTKPNTSDLLSALTAVQGAIMASNGIAFMQSGEELFRTKKLDSIKDKNYSSDYYCVMYGDKVSHNSYCASDECNSFKWDRKISVNGVSTAPYFKSLVNAIKIHNENKKFAFPDNFNTANIHCWNEAGDNEYMGSGTTVAAQINNYYLFFNGRNTNGCALPLGNDVRNSTLVFNSRSTSTASTPSTTGITFTNADGYSKMSLQAYQLVIYKK